MLMGGHPTREVRLQPVDYGKISKKAEGFHFFSSKTQILVRLKKS